MGLPGDHLDSDDDDDGDGDGGDKDDVGNDPDEDLYIEQARPAAVSSRGAFQGGVA